MPIYTRGYGCERACEIFTFRGDIPLLAQGQILIEKQEIAIDTFAGVSRTARLVARTRIGWHALAAMVRTSHIEGASNGPS